MLVHKPKKQLEKSRYSVSVGSRETALPRKRVVLEDNRPKPIVQRHLQRNVNVDRITSSWPIQMAGAANQGKIEYKYGKQDSGFFIRGELDVRTSMLTFTICANDKNKGKHYAKKFNKGENDSDIKPLTGRWLFHKMIDYYDSKDFQVEGIEAKWLDSHPKLSANAKSYREGIASGKAQSEAARNTFTGKVAGEKGFESIEVKKDDQEYEYYTGRNVRPEGGGR